MKIMNKEEILWLYELGERNFRRQNLRGKSFRGEDLSGIDFSGSDIRGADFTNAILNEVNFTNATAGLQRRQAAIVLVVFLMLAGLLGVLAGLVGTFVGLRVYTHGIGDVTVKWVITLVNLGFAFVSLNRGMATGSLIFILAFILTGAAAFASSDIVPIAGDIVVVITVNTFIAVATAAAGVISIAAVLAFRTAVASTVAITFILGFAVAVAIANHIALDKTTNGNLFTIAMAAALILLNFYIDWRAIRGDQRHITFWAIANTLATKWGTSFRGADLTRADFSRAILTSTDFTKANLTRTHWSKSVGIGFLHSDTDSVVPY